MRSDSRTVEQVLSLCPTCLKTIPAVIVETSSCVELQKTCPEHGFVAVTVSCDRATYERIRHSPRKVTWPASWATDVRDGCPHDCGLCPSHDQHTCLAILDVTSRCDLRCPICLAAAVPDGYDLDLSSVEFALQALIKSEGGFPPLQLSGGEPTLHPDLVEIVRCAARLGFRKIEIDSNGLALAGDPSLADRLRDAGLSQVYLQMDGLDAAVSEFIRGRDIVAEKLKAIDHCRRAGLQVALSVTVVPGVNDYCLWKMVRFGVEQRLSGVSFQAICLSGRYPPALRSRSERMTLGHFARKLEEQSGGALLADELRPLPCPDPRCGALCYALIHANELVPLSRLLGKAALEEFEASMSDWEAVLGALEARPRSSCGCACSCDPPPPIPSNLLRDSDLFSIGFHGMMDAFTFDVNRARRCCVHALVPDGRLIPFCLYNILYRRGHRRVQNVVCTVATSMARKGSRPFAGVDGCTSASTTPITCQASRIGCSTCRDATSPR